MVDNHKCLHEERILNQSKAIERLDAELIYKKERLDDLKEDNRRMEEKIDEIKNCLNKVVVKSKTDDDKLERRLVAIETEQRVIKELTDQNRADFNFKLTIVTIIFGAISLFIALLTFYFNFIILLW